MMNPLRIKHQEATFQDPVDRIPPTRNRPKISMLYKPSDKKIFQILLTGNDL